MLFRRRRQQTRVSALEPVQIADRIALLKLLAARSSCESYLEIGCNRNKVFKAIELPQKIGVDPQRGGTHRMTSDEYFRQNDRKFDLVLVDGLHRADQVLRDVDNSLAALNPNGIIVLHDCNPPSEEAQRTRPSRRHVYWNGDVWKAAVILRGRPDIDFAVGDFDHGCGVLLPRPNTLTLEIEHTLETLRYADLESNRKGWLRLMSGSELVEFIDG